ncbi:restriction endonuclease subunit S [Xenophilus arseniciresistens]|uniref:Restriction endonuclease subunit S n=1 Tax=Xenophilus arseniciresistens TaxID=1283306 RepID=A0AAE3T187_9BURK|nr:restriction endonuclease subunit S [Xenophilus arseniciresistens]MDA7417741.1 restriction endonuclease subunit S [Xenophilus arseniciresistens]
MSFEWMFPTAQLAEAATFINGDRSSNYPSQDDYIPGGVPFISAADLRDGRLQLESVRRITPAAFARLRAGKIEHNDILFCLRGSIGKMALVYPGESGAIASSLVVIRARPTVDPRYLYFFLCSAAGQQSAVSLNNGSAQPNLSVGQLQRISLPLPSLQVQREVAALLGSLDDRITLLRETNATLEAIAQALFKSWFVDFDPVRAKMEGRAPEGMDEATAALFPDRFEESELGLVPKGWSVGTLQDLLVLQRGFDLPSHDRVAGAFPIIAASGPSGTHKVAMAKGPGVVTGRSGVLGRVFIELGDYWPLNTTLWVKEFKAASPCYAYELLRGLDFGSFNAGSAVPTLNRNHLHGLNYLIPSRLCVDAYEATAIRVHERVKSNALQSQTLATLRDTLLPRLISGHLRLPEAMEMVDDAARNVTS